MNTEPQKLIVLIAGSRWENTRGTDHRLAEALAKRATVLWVDPPVPVLGPASAGRPPLWPGHALDGIEPGLFRLRVAVPPGFTRPVLRMVANKLMGRAVRATVEQLAMEQCATMVMSPRQQFPAGLAGRKILHVTDDWIAGASMMGLSAHSVSQTLQKNIDEADVVCIVSPSLGSLVTQRSTRHDPVLLPNGCIAVPGVLPTQPKRRAVAALLGQLNERLDFDLLDELVSGGVDIEVIGPRRDRDAAASRRLDSFLTSDGVTWLGEIPEEQAFARMRELAVGITPYADNAFNQASFPLKTLDYLAAGMQVVSTDLPAARWLNTEWVDIAVSRTDFVASVRKALHDDRAEDAVAERLTFAASHTWDARAKQLMALIAEQVP